MIAHIGWSPEQLRVERERRLRELIDAAVTRSTWHRARLTGLDPGTVTEDTLAGLPTMTKDDLLEHTSTTSSPIPGCHGIWSRRTSLRW
jgi:phenylacetate-coenzyme A ligase PaaK-like adenylate-forming protein